MEQQNAEQEGAEFFEAFESGDPETEQQIRENYYTMLDKIQVASDRAGDGTVPLAQLKDLTLEANSVFSEVKRPLEAKLDSQLMKMIGALGRTNVQKAQSGFLNFEPMEFAEKQTQFMCRGGDIDVLEDVSSWAELGESCCNIYKTSFGVKSLPGALLDWTPLERIPRERQRQAIDEVTARRVPQKMDQTEHNEETELAEVITVRRALVAQFKKSNMQPINLMEFILDPTSFSKSVENLFHLSFLVRDSHAEIKYDENQIPQVAPLPVKQKNKPSDQSSNQALFTLTVPLYKELISLLEITEPMIPNEPTRGIKRSMVET